MVRYKSIPYCYQKDAHMSGTRQTYHRERSHATKEIGERDKQRCPLFDQAHRHNREWRITCLNPDEQSAEHDARKQESPDQRMCPRKLFSRLQRQAEKQAADHADQRERTEYIDTSQFRMQRLVLHFVRKTDGDFQDHQNEREYEDGHLCHASIVACSFRLQVSMSGVECDRVRGYRYGMIVFRN